MPPKKAGLDISAAQEDRIREALKSLNLAEDEEAAAPTLPCVAAPHALALLNEAYLDLVRQGFQRPQVEAALSALPLSEVSTASALDWLLLHLDAADLPRRYTDSSRARGPVELRHKPKEAPPQEQLQAEKERQQRAAEAAKLAEAAAALAAHAAAQEAERQRQREEQEKASRRAWILQYAEESSESDVASEGGKSTASVVEDWEVWGDPREIERRRGERRRGQLPREERLALVAQELRQAKEGAAAAKASGDKGRQRSWGQVIGYLKREMVELGVAEEELPGATAVPIAAENGSGGGDDSSQLQSGGGGGATAGGADTSDGSGPAGAAGSELAEAGAGGSHGAGSEDEGLGGFDVFGDDASQLQSVPGSKRRPAAIAAEALLPWGGGGKKGAKRGGKAAQPKAPEFQQPKALLQQLCQEQGWPAPRYERLAAGGGRLESSTGLRYCVTVDAGGGGGGGALKRRGGRGPKQQQQQRPGPRTFSLRGGDDGWERVEEAQGAAATLALLELGGAGQPELWRQLPPPYNELWLTWREEGTGAALEESSEETAAREVFIQQLVRAKQAEAASAAAAAAAAGQGGSMPGASQPASLWSEELQRRLGRGGSTGQAAAQREEGDRMLRALRQWRGSEEGRRWQEDRGRLPVSALRCPLEEALAEHDVVVVSGETGSGKTTQVPQFILEAATEAGAGGECSVVCTQPRRIAAISVAERVAEERGEPAPGRRGGRVGYAVRLDSASTADTRLLFCTTGILLRRLTGDPALGEVSHVVVDEVHERTLQGDFLIALLRDLVAHRRAAGRPLKVVLMSATLDSALFADYFGAGTPVLHAEGRAFPVQQLFLEDVYEMTGYVLASDAPAALRAGRDRGAQRRLAATAGSRNAAAVRAGWGDDEGDGPPLNPNYDEQRYQGYSVATRRNLGRVDEDRSDFDLLEDLVGAIDEEQGEGAVLVFLPGMAEISALHNRLVASRRFAAAAHWVVPLHSSVAPAEQRRAFQRPPPGARKVVLATNIAETSLTIEDVVAVVDSGRLKERRHDPARGMSLLVEDWVSAASARQRRGRAGRVRAGVCYALYTRHRHDNCMKRYQAPEMVRVPLDELVLQIHLLRLGRRAGDFLARVLQPPPERAVEGAVRVLREVGALTPGEELTPLGHHLAQLPVDARVGKLLLLSACLGCLSPALTIAACLSYKSPFAGGLQQADAAERARAALAAPGSRTIAAGQQSDHLVMAAAVDGWVQAARRGGAKAGRDHARKHLLSEQTLEMVADMRWQFATMLADIGFAAKGGGGQGRRWMDDPELPANRYAAHPAVIKAVLLAALYPNIAIMDDAEAGPGRRPAWHDGSGDVAIHPSSALHPLEAARFHRPFITFLEKVRTTKAFIRDCTVVSPAAILLFGGKLEMEHEAGRVLVDGWIRIRAAPAVAVAVKRLRRALEAVLRRKVAAPRVGVEEAGGKVVAAIVELLNHEEAAQGWGR